MPKFTKKKSSLQNLIKKASDVNLNTAIALSKSLKDLEKQNRKNAKEKNTTPFHLMKDPIEVKKVLDLRLSNLILQSFQINLIDIVPRHTCKLWDKASLYCDIKPGDLSYDNINLSELMDYYVSALIPYISPSTYREGDKMLNVSKIVGRERSIIYSNENVSPNEAVNDTFNVIEIDNSIRFLLEASNDANLVESNIVNEDLINLSSTEDSGNSNLLPVNISATPENDLGQCKFLKMFNKDKFSDFIVFLKSETILYLHKFVLAAWNCDAENLKDTQQCILNIDDETVIKLLKHLYSDGKYNIDDIIDSDDCLELCKIFGLNWSLLQKHSLIVPFDPSCKRINKTQIISSDGIELLASVKSVDSIKFPENNCDLSIDNILSKSIINLAQSTPNHSILTNRTCEVTIKKNSNYSEKDLFESYDIDFDETTNSAVNTTLEDIVNPIIQKIKEPRNSYRKLCSFNNEHVTYCPYTLTKDTQAPNKRNNMENVLTALPTQQENVLTALPAQQEDFLTALPAQQEDFLTALPVQQENNHIIQLSNQNPKIFYPNFPSLTFCNIHEDDISNDEIINVTELDSIIPSGLVDSINSEKICEENSHRLFDEINIPTHISMTFDEEISFNHSDMAEIRPNDNLENNSILIVKENIFQENSPLPLRQRLGLKSLTSDINIINISSDEEMPNNKIKKSKKRSSGKIETIHSNSEFVAENSREIKPKKSRTKIITDKLQRKSKKSLKDINVEKNLPKEPKVMKEKKTRKRKSSEILNVYSTPIKQQILTEPFTPVPDFSLVSSSVIKGKCMQFGIKGVLAKNYKKKILEKLHIYERIKNHSLSSSSNSESTNVSFRENEAIESSDSKDENVLDDLNDNIQLYTFLKATYFKDILTYKPLDIKKVLSKLKENNIKISLKKLNDYFDNQCILYTSGENNKKSNKFNRPKKASKMIL